MERLQKLLAAAGVASRRGAEALIVAGRVRVNGRVVRELGAKAEVSDRIEVDGEVIGSPLRERTIMLHKPPGCVTTRSDPGGRHTVYDLLYSTDRQLHPVGRLDFDSTGLLLLTNDGELTHRLTHPSFGIEKVYRVATKPWPTEEICRRLRAGVELDDGPAKPRRVRYVHADTAEITMAEGRRREVRRMLEAVGCEVLFLCRISYGPLRLGQLRQGAARPLKADELARLRAAVGLADDGSDEPSRPAGAAPARPG